MSVRALLIWGVIALLLVVLFAALQGPSATEGVPEISYSAFLDRVEAGELKSVTTDRDMLVGRSKSDREFITFLPAGAMPDTLRALRAAHVEVRAVRQRQGPTLGDILLGVLPMLLLIGAWFFFMRQMQKKGPGAMG